MCTRILVDASLLYIAAGDVAPDPLLVDWLEGQNCVLCYASAGGYASEVTMNANFAELLGTKRMKGDIVEVSGEQLLDARIKLSGPATKGRIKSNDLHVLEVVVACETSVLVSKDDRLREDFKLVTQSLGFPARIYPHRSTDNSRRKFINQHRCAR